jgi:hypothetical protein
MFLSSPHEHANLIEWEQHLKNLLLEDQRKPFIAMAVRRAKQHIEKRKLHELQKSQSNPEAPEEPKS